MFKLYSDKKNLNNVKLNINTKNIINTAKISVFATTLALTLITVNNRKVHVIEDETIHVGNVPMILNEKTITYKDYIFDEYVEKAEKYSHLLLINEDICKNEISKKLQNVSEEQYKNNFSILENGKYSDLVDVQVVLFLKDIKDNYNNYGYDESLIKSEYNDESNLTIREMVYEYSEAFGVDPEIALAISCGESGWYEKDIATVNNNPFSYRLKSGKFASFPSLERGIMEGILNLRLNYYEYGLNTIDSIQRKYCTEGGEHWLSLIKGTYKELENGKELYDEKGLNLVYKEE